MIAPEWLSSKATEIAYMKSKGGVIKMCHNYKGVVRSSDIRKKLIERVTEVKQAIDWNLPENRTKMEKANPASCLIGNLNRN